MKKISRSRVRFDPLNVLDDANGSCARIAALADLLCCSAPEQLNPQTLTGLAGCLSQEARQLQKALTAFGRLLPREAA